MHPRSETAGHKASSSQDFSERPLAAPMPDISSLNGIRAVAVCLVIFAHSGLENIVPGGLGVTIFFVLSGYLITTLMRREYAVSGTIALVAFYLRRGLRLMPPLFIVVAVTALLSSISAIDGIFSAQGLCSVLFYFGNYHVISHDFQGLPTGLGVVWSLAVEEHYYLLYPPLALLLLRSRSHWMPVAVLASVCTAILAWRLWLMHHGDYESYISMATDTRADAILIGCIMAFLCTPLSDPTPSVLSNGRLAMLLSSVILLIATLTYRNDFFRFTGRYTLQSMAIAPLIYSAVSFPGHMAFRWLNSRPMVYLGSVSYTIYLSHQLIYFSVLRHLPTAGWATTLGLTMAASLAVAEPMRRWIETPCMRLRKQLHQYAYRRDSTDRESRLVAQ